ncbi:flagellar motor protein MotB [Segnochrobactrum spirostomi]|uniref:OmpA family protein n=1 Tax=Segnochrobactrum spirostomi TaxID=2608987 RepID=A0A6A7Y3U4_9HYPH|nr:flagellar motor protein MotB [Segnochrobactrum spirostomi]MQT12771.1 OmpA family protein [Segnochrobactrum spirostomi]
MSQEHQELIIVKRHEEEEHEAHSSAWKVAHADFMTAMMAFFLIMWLVNVTDDEVKKSIANYFNPVNLTASISNQKGLNQPSDKAGESKGAAKPGSKPEDKKKKGSGAPGASTGAKSEGGAGGELGEKSGGAPSEAVSGSADGTGASDGSLGGGAGTATAELRAFQDPYAVLAKLAAEVPPPAEGATADNIVGEPSVPGVAGGSTPRDPFDPVYWQTNGGMNPKSAKPGQKGTGGSAPNDGNLDAAGVDTSSGTPPQAPNPAPAKANPAAQTAAAQAAQAQANKAITENLDPKAAAIVEAAMAGVVPPVEVLAPEKPKTAGQKAPTTAVKQKAEDLGAELNNKIAAAIQGTDMPHVAVQATSEGVLISLTDDIDFSMFPSGSAIPEPKVVVAMEKLAKTLSERPGGVVIRGYTDGRPFKSDTYDNWRLSSARAQMAFYMLKRGGLDSKRVMRIESFADRDLKNQKDPGAAENRRIEILLQEPTA